ARHRALSVRPVCGLQGNPPRTGEGEVYSRSRGGDRYPREPRKTGARASLAAASRARMGGVVDGGQSLEIECGVNLRRRDARVAEQLLHRAQVAARLQQMA